MSPVWAESVNARTLATRLEELEGVLPVAQLPRLREMLVETQGDVTVALHFALGEDDVPIVDGRVRARLQATCQRCLQPLDLDVETELHLAVVKSEAAGEHLREPYDAWVAVDENVSIAAAVEDELLLALPMAPMHEDPQACGPLARRLEGLGASDESAGEVRTPFAGLRDLLQD